MSTTDEWDLDRIAAINRDRAATKAAGVGVNLNNRKVGNLTNGQYNLLTSILRQYIDERGWILYSQIKEDPRLKQVVDDLCNRDISKFDSKNHAVAFWINLFNVMTIKLVCDRMPIESINQLNTGGMCGLCRVSIWKSFVFEVGTKGEKFSLDQIQNTVLRSSEYQDPRINAALALASFSSPQLSNQAYEPDTLDTQLDSAMTKFMTDQTKNLLLPSTNILYLSSIFKWPGVMSECSNFGARIGAPPLSPSSSDSSNPSSSSSSSPSSADPSSPLATMGIQHRQIFIFLYKYLSSEMKTFLITKADKPPKISYLEYNWGLNGS